MQKLYIELYRGLSFNKLTSHADIRFFLDVPKEVRLRRKLEKELIYLWLPPFNKETRGSGPQPLQTTKNLIY